MKINDYELTDAEKYLELMEVEARESDRERCIKPIKVKPVLRPNSRSQATEILYFLNISKTTFNTWVSTGKFPEPTHKSRNKRFWCNKVVTKWFMEHNINYQ